MSHQVKQSIFNQLSQNIDPETIIMGSVPPLERLDQFEDFEDLLLAFRYSNISLKSLTKIIFEACDLVQEEQQKRIAENTKMLLHDGFHKSNKQTKYYQIGTDNLQIDKDSIINPENKIQ